MVRCVPPIGGHRPEYADAACTDEIWQAWGSVIAVAGDPALNAAVLETKHNYVYLPNVVRALSDGVRYHGPVYQRKGADCTLIPGIPHARAWYYRYGSEVPLAALVSMPIVEH